MGQQTVGTRYPDEIVAAIDAAAARLGLKRSEYMRLAVDAALKTTFPQSAADAYREVPRLKRADAGVTRSGSQAADPRPLARTHVNPRPKASNGKAARR